jgi:hypothetical protein
MAVQLSPGVQVKESDLTSVVPAVSASNGAFAGTFQWGPVLEPTLVSNENELVKQFGKPKQDNFQSFFTAANFLAYATNLLVTRADVAGLKNAVSSGTAIKIKNTDDYETNYANGGADVGEFAAKYPGALGNSLKVSMADGATYSTWDYKAEFSSAPSTSEYVANQNGQLDELHIIVIDEDGLWTGTQGAILEKFAFVSKANDAKSFDGTSSYYINVINSRSKYIWWTDHPTALTVGGDAWGTAAHNVLFKELTAAVTRSLSGGVDDYTATDGELLDAWVLYADDTLYDIGLLPIGKASASLASSIIADVIEMRTDVIAFISPEDITSGEPIIGTGKASDVNAYRNGLPSTSYGFLDSGYKYQYDRYNDKYRWVPLNGDIAGLCARTDATNDAWWSPAGLNRGQIKNVVKLAYNPNKADRDALYSNGVNPVVTFPGQGTVLYGDKTLLSKPSAFDRINVRRLFIVLEKAIAKASRYQLFEFNDSFTQAQFRSLVEPFLRDVQGRRGITAFKVVCDSTNNTAEIVNTNQFVGDIFIQPNYSINYITLNFIASKQGVAFTTTGA